MTDKLSALSEPDDEDDDVDVPYCGECWESFRDDDTGGYNPSCACGVRCRSCCADDCLNAPERDDYGEDDPDDERSEEPA